MFSEVFFFFLFLVISLIEREVKEEENVLSTVSVSKSILKLLFYKSGCKGKNFKA